MMNRNKLVVALLLAVFSLLTSKHTGSLNAQDQHFTQFYASPLTLNPALAGAFQGKYRLSLIYRDQARNIVEEPYVTFSGAMDFRFPVGTRTTRVKDAIGAGILFYNDKVPNIGFSTNQIFFAGAYHKSLGSSNEQFLSLGFQIGLSQRNVNYERITFGDQFNGQNGYTDPTAETLPENNFAFADYGVGLNYSYAPDKGTAVYIGGALHHILEPQVGFFFNEDEPEDFEKEFLNRKYTAYLNFSIPMGTAVRFSPRVLAYSQGAHLAINSGFNFRFLLDEISGTALHVGGWARPVKDVDQALDLDAIIMMAGVEFNNFLIGFSYDAAFGQITTTRSGQTAFEISIAYLGEYVDETVLCPKF